MPYPALPSPLARSTCRLLLCLSGLLYLPGAWAILGQPLPAPTAAGSGPVRAALSGTLGSGATSLYTTRVSTLNTGVQVTEYATPDGTVFALAWQGPVLPPLETLLGTYFQQFQTEADASRSYRSIGTPLQIRTSTLVVRSGGRMRNFFGHAYDPQRVPNGLNINDLLP